MRLGLFAEMLLAPLLLRPRICGGARSGRELATYITQLH
jgi:hypothetical protein